MDRRLIARTAPIALVLALALTGCGSDEVDPNTPTGQATEPTTPSTDTPSPSETPSETESPNESATTITITREGDTFSPNGERMKVPMGEELLLVVVSDTAGELHVHSTPEQEIAYKAGTSTHTLTFDKPGVVEVESHEPAAVVLQLQVS